MSDKLFGLFVKANYVLLDLFPMTFDNFELARQLYLEYPTRLSLDKYFEIACEQNHLKLAQWTYKKFYRNDHKLLHPDLLVKCCVKGDTAMIKWVFYKCLRKNKKCLQKSKMPFNIHIFMENLHRMISVQCKLNRLDIIEMILSFHDQYQSIKRIKKFSGDFFYTACIHRSLDVAKYFHKLNYFPRGQNKRLLVKTLKTGNQELITLVNSILTPEEMIKQHKYQLKTLVKNGDIDKLLDTLELPNNELIHYLFFVACGHNQIRVVEYFLENFLIEINPSMFMIIKLMYKIFVRGHLEVIKILYDYYPECRNLLYSNLFDCTNNSVEIINWVVNTLGKPQFDLDSDDTNRYFLIACQKGSLVLAKWILKEYPETSPQKVDKDTIHPDVKPWFDTISKYY